MDNLKLQFETDGYLKIDNALLSDELAILNEALARDFEQHRETYYLRSDETFQSVRTLDHEPEFDRLIRHPSTFPVLCELMNDDIAFSEFSVIIKGPNTSTHSEWHKDIGYKGVDLTNSVLLISCIYYLSDVPQDGAAFTVLPGSHRSSDPVTKPKNLDEMDGHEKLIGQAGTAILFNANLWHCAMPNRSKLWRKTAHLYYCRPWMKPTGHTAFPPRWLENAITLEDKKFFHAQWGAVK